MLLAIETATDVCSVALVDDGAVVSVGEVLRPRAHAEQLAPLITDVLRRARVVARDLAAVAVSSGPGSYTGLRIGVSTAKGLCLAAGSGLVAVPTLEALAWTVSRVAAKGDLIIAALPSRAGELYLAAFVSGPTGLGEALGPVALRIDEVAAWTPDAAGETWLIGDAAGDVSRLIGREHRVVGDGVHRPTAIAVAALGWNRWKLGTEEDIAAFEPLYIKPFEVRRRTSPFDRLPH